MSLIDNIVAIAIRMISKPFRLYIHLIVTITCALITYGKSLLPDNISQYGSNVGKVVVIVVVYGAISGILLSLTSVMYTVFYWLYIPTYSMVSPAHFQFDSTASSHPVATIDFLHHRTHLRNDIPYDMFVTLELPESPANKEVGMFMVNVELSSSQNNDTYRVSRSDILYYRSPLLSGMMTLFWSPIYLLGYTLEAQTHTLPVFENFVSVSAIGHVDKAVLLLSKPTLEVYGASIRVDACFSGLRYYMYWWPLTTAFAVIGIFFFWEFCFVFFTLKKMNLHSFREVDLVNDNINNISLTDLQGNNRQTDSDVSQHVDNVGSRDILLGGDFLQDISLNRSSNDENSSVHDIDAVNDTLSDLREGNEVDSDIDGDHDNELLHNLGIRQRILN